MLSIEHDLNSLSGGCQQLSAASRDDKGNAIIGLSGLGKLGLLLESANKMVLSMKRARTLLPVKSS